MATAQPTTDDALPLRRTTIIRRPLETGWARRRLIHDLARDEFKQTELAATYGVSKSAICQFRQRHLNEIDALQRDMEDEYRHLWIAQKGARLAEYQADVEEVNDRLDSAIGELLGAWAESTEDELEQTARVAALEAALVAEPQWMRIKHAALRAVAEEMGHLPTKTRVELSGGVGLNYRVNGVDVERMR